MSVTASEALERSPLTGGVEVLVNGQPKEDPESEPCRHQRIGETILVAEIERDEGGTFREVKLKLMCLDCGAPAVFDVPSARPSNADGTRGIVCRFDLLDVEG